MSVHPFAVARAALAYRACQLCEHRCGVDRTAGPQGRCHADATARVFRQRVEYGEELELTPSHLFYLSGCDLRCVFCIAEQDAFDPRRGVPLTGELLRAALRQARPQRARNIQWVGGEPTIHLPAILAAMSQCKRLPSVVWKSDFYGTPEALVLLDGVVDTYVADFKFGNDRCAQRLAKIDRYMSVVTRNLRWAAAHGNLIVRHLLLPGHFDCCYRPIVSWLRQHLRQVKFSLRESYLPRWHAVRHAPLNQVVDRDLAAAARRLAHRYLQVVR